MFLCKLILFKYYSKEVKFIYEDFFFYNNLIYWGKMTKSSNQPRNWYTGPYIDQMDHLISDGGAPFSILDLIKTRINMRNNKSKDLWWYNSFNSVDGIAYHRDGRVKIVLEALPLMGIISESDIWQGGLVLPGDMYERLDGVELRKDELEMYNSIKNPTREQIENNIIWIDLVRGYSLSDVTGIFYRSMDKHNMRINIDPHPEFPENGPSSIIKPLSLDGVNQSSTLHTGSLTDPIGILVGEFTPTSSLETIL